MSWDEYLNNIIQRTKTAAGDFNSDKACIIGLNGAKWTADTHANVSYILFFSLLPWS